MSKKSERRLRYTISIIGLLFAMSILVIIVDKLEYRALTTNFNEKIESVVIAVNKQYPDVSPNEIIKVIIKENDNEENMFNSYGIFNDKDEILQENIKVHSKYLLIKLISSFIIVFSVVFFFMRRNNKKNKDIDEILKYIEKINKGNYEIKIDNNVEDELSILKNEVYKTTIMLKEAEMNSKNDKLMLKDSLSDISHQLKTPITSLMINLENLEEYPELPEEQRLKLVKNATRDVNNISFMVQYILKLSKLDSNTIDYNNNETEIAEIINGAIENVRALSDLKNINISLISNESAIINCDSYWQTEAITNILKNAIEYANSEVVISYEKNQVFSQIVIENDGEPISLEDRKHIFERFYKGKKSGRDSVGIGLALSKSIIEHAGGYITVESSDDKTNVINDESKKYTKFIIKYL